MNSKKFLLSEIFQYFDQGSNKKLHYATKTTCCQLYVPSAIKRTTQKSSYCSNSFSIQIYFGNKSLLTLPSCTKMYVRNYNYFALNICSSNYVSLLSRQYYQKLMNAWIIHIVNNFWECCDWTVKQHREVIFNYSYSVIIILAIVKSTSCTTKGSIYIYFLFLNFPLVFDSVPWMWIATDNSMEWNSLNCFMKYNYIFFSSDILMHKRISAV